MFDRGRSSTSASSSSPLTVSAVEFGAVAAAVLFAAHPMHTESVSNVTNRSELLSFIAQLGGFLVFLRSQTSTSSTIAAISGFVAVLGCTVVAALCKETGVMLVPLCVVVDFISANGLNGFYQWLLHDKRPTLNRAVCIRAATFAAFLAGFMYARLSLQGGPAPVWFGPTNAAANADSLQTRALSFAYIDWVHFNLLLVPTTFCPDWRKCVPLVESFADPKAWIAVTFFTMLALRAWHCIKHESARAEAIGWAWLVLPFVRVCMHVCSLSRSLSAAALQVTLWHILKPPSLPSSPQCSHNLVLLFAFRSRRNTIAPHAHSLVMVRCLRPTCSFTLASQWRRG